MHSLQLTSIIPWKTDSKHPELFMMFPLGNHSSLAQILPYSDNKLKMGQNGVDGCRCFPKCGELQGVMVCTLCHSVCTRAKCKCQIIYHLNNSKVRENPLK